MGDDKMTKAKKVRVVIWSISILLTLGFIFINSCLSKSSSSSESEGLFAKLQPAFDFIFGEGVVTHGFFRKLAHFGEFGLLGLEINLLYFELFGQNRKKIYQGLRLGLYVALIDETIQVFSERGPAIVDVWIDFAGFLTATVLFYMIIGMIRTLKKAKEKGEAKKETFVSETETEEKEQTEQN